MLHAQAPEQWSKCIRIGKAKGFSGSNSLPDLSSNDSEIWYV